jgi:tetratricopeptide (TPR) repeat protein
MTFTALDWSAVAPTRHPGDSGEAIWRTVQTGPQTFIDGAVQENPGSGLLQFVRGRLMSQAGRSDEALANYDMATALDPTLADAWYNAGVLLAEANRLDEALVRFQRTVEADPEHIDALYNAGQVNYNLGRFQPAMEAWQRAQMLAPQDFDILKKVLQCQNALGLYSDAEATRTALLELWRISPDPSVRALTEYVFDQFDVSGQHVFAFENLTPGGDLYYLYTFSTTMSDGRPFSVNLESSAVITEMGTPYVVGIDAADGRHITTGPFYAELPAYADLKPVIIDTIGRVLRGEL